MIVPIAAPDEKHHLATYLAIKLGCTVHELVGTVPYEIVAVARNGYPVGAVMYTNYRLNSIEMSCAGDPGWLTRHDLRELFRYPFVQLGCTTALTIVKRRNDVARTFNERLGFVALGVIESDQGRADDSIIHTMPRHKCRWLSSTDLASIASKRVPPAISGVHAHG